MLEKQTWQARATWVETISVSGTLAEAYLRGRAIRSLLPPTLRFHPSCWHQSARRMPALVAGVEVGDEIVAVHRTYLAEPGSKADVEPVKAMLGPVAGGAVRLSNGTSTLVVAEGIETALSILDGLGGLDVRVWAALSAGGMSGVVLPEEPGELAIAPEADDTGRQAQRPWRSGLRAWVGASSSSTRLTRATGMMLRTRRSR